MWRTIILSYFHIFFLFRFPIDSTSTRFLLLPSEDDFYQLHFFSIVYCFSNYFLDLCYWCSVVRRTNTLHILCQYTTTLAEYRCIFCLIWMFSSFSCSFQVIRCYLRCYYFDALSNSVFNYALYFPFHLLNDLR